MLVFKVRASVSFFLAFVLQASHFKFEECVPPGPGVQRFVYILCLVGNVADFSSVCLISDLLEVEFFFLFTFKRSFFCKEIMECL